MMIDFLIGGLYAIGGICAIHHHMKQDSPQHPQQEIDYNFIVDFADRLHDHTRRLTALQDIQTQLELYPGQLYRVSTTTVAGADISAKMAIDAGMVSDAISSEKSAINAILAELEIMGRIEKHDETNIEKHDNNRKLKGSARNG